MTRRNREGFSCGHFMSRLDLLGEDVTLNYRRSKTYGTLAGGICSIIALLTMIFYVVIQMHALVNKPDYEIRQTTTYSSIDSFSPVMTNDNYSAFPVIAMRKTTVVDSVTTYEDINDQYNVFMTFKEISDEGVETTDVVFMTDCADITDSQFLDGGVYYDFFENIDGTALCPSDPQIDIHGYQGTNLFVVPKDYATHNDGDNFAIAYMVSQNFGFTDFLEDEANAMEVKYEQRQITFLKLPSVFNVWYDTQYLNVKLTKEDTLLYNIQKAFDYYAFPWVQPSGTSDYSQFNSVASPGTFNYQSTPDCSEEPLSFYDINCQAIIFQMSLEGANYATQQLYTVQTFDEIVGIMGGVCILIFGVFFILMRGYESFKMRTSLVKSLYSKAIVFPTAEQELRMEKDAEDAGYISVQHNEGGQAEGGSKADDDRMDAVVDGLYKNTGMNETQLIETQLSNREQYTINFFEHTLSALIRYLCCCCANQSFVRENIKKHKMHTSGVERMHSELDIVALVQSLRLSEFLHKTLLKKHQRFFVNKFRMYNISGIEREDMNMADRIRLEDNLTAAGYSSDAYDESNRKMMIDRLDPTNRTDAKVIYNLTGRELKAYAKKNNIMDSQSPDNVRSPDDYNSSPKHKGARQFESPSPFKIDAHSVNNGITEQKVIAPAHIQHESPDRVENYSIQHGDQNLDNIPTHRDRSESKNQQFEFQETNNVMDVEVIHDNKKKSKKGKKKKRHDKMVAIQETLFENHNRHESHNTANFEDAHGMPVYDEHVPVSSKRKEKKKTKKSRANDELQQPLFDQNDYQQEVDMKQYQEVIEHHDNEVQGHGIMVPKRKKKRGEQQMAFSSASYGLAGTEHGILIDSREGVSDYVQQQYNEGTQQAYEDHIAQSHKKSSSKSKSPSKTRKQKSGPQKISSPVDNPLEESLQLKSVTSGVVKNPQWPNRQ